MNAKIKPRRRMRGARLADAPGVAMRALLAGALLCGLALPGPLAAQAGSELKIAYVDMQRLLDGAPQMAAARERLAREFAARDAALKQDQGRLASMETRLREEGAFIQRDEAERLKQQTDALRRSVERSRERMRDELTRRTREEADRAFPAISEAVAEYARAQGIDLVLTSPVIYYNAKIDITDRVIDSLRSAGAE
ncbi:OmpH family outer membrane protein [Pseudomarimonas arenosa]|uniref:OmpH family outer membrane protein n=1 Tax=Pseudomarimonas arenosa TaxID=2774145 RepID=A0AAW3ZSP6_9GAMM|nr:OmpH family outer membrane protein [Pseudomarimonas arenosa]MBD8527226.1 OmpH family outer membrane protein [Pseudomarimonas arenosa]